MGTWDLTMIYGGFIAPKFLSDMDALKQTGEQIRALAKKAKDMDDRELLLEYVQLTEKMTSLANDLAIYSNLCYSANTKDSAAASALGRVMDIVSGTAAADAALKKHIASIENLERIIRSTFGLRGFEYFLTNIKRDSKYLLSDGEEEVFAKMNISGASAWSDLHSTLTSSVTANVGGEEMGLSSVRNLAYSPDADKRREAYFAELQCYEKIKDPIAFSLNSIKLQVLNECELRGYESPLAKSLYTSRMKPETLDALMSAIEDYLPIFRKYLKTKAKALGHEGGLPWYDLFAPMGKIDKTYTKDEARDYLVKIFEGADCDLARLVSRAFADRWIDFYPREGKVGGAFDCGVPSIGESRILTNFDGSFSSIVTLAHELGHAFHDKQVFSHSQLNQEYSMPVAETASTFNEILVMDYAIEHASSDEERLALVENQLMDACQIITDIYSRFLFEKSVFEARRDEFLSADRLSELMLEAQKKAYGDGLDENYMHKYMWLCKGHYYSGSLSYYNFPYAFGGLFARGLYAMCLTDKVTFFYNYKKMLSRTTLCDIEDCAKIANVDLTSKDFWRSGLETIAIEIGEFISLTKKLSQRKDI